MRRKEEQMIWTLDYLFAASVLASKKKLLGTNLGFDRDDVRDFAFVDLFERQFPGKVFYADTDKWYPLAVNRLRGICTSLTQRGLVIRTMVTDKRDRSWNYVYRIAKHALFQLDENNRTAESFILDE